MALGKFALELQQAGVSPEGTQRAITEIQNGASPGHVIRDAAAPLGNYAGALGEGAKAHAGALPSGRHWGTAPVWSHADIEALKGFGAKLGEPSHLDRTGLGCLQKGIGEQLERGK